ncbi:unnamed protein product [Gadus morhua 'NCC']
MVRLMSSQPDGGGGGASGQTSSDTRRGGTNMIVSFCYVQSFSFRIPRTFPLVSRYHSVLDAGNRTRSQIKSGSKNEFCHPRIMGDVSDRDQQINSVSPLSSFLGFFLFCM